MATAFEGRRLEAESITVKVLLLFFFEGSLRVKVNIYRHNSVNTYSASGVTTGSVSEG
jgi:hypothetical protein